MWFVTDAQSHAAMEADTGTDAGFRANVGIEATSSNIIIIYIYQDYYGTFIKRFKPFI